MENPFKQPSSLRAGVPRFGTPDGGNKIPEHHHEGLADGFNLSKEVWSPREKDPRESLIEEIDEAIKIKSMINQIGPSKQPLPLDLKPQLVNSNLFQNFDPSILLHLAAIIQNKNVGLRGNICSNCLTWWIDPLCNNVGEMTSLIYTKPYRHTCKSKDLAEAAKVQDASSKKNELENQLVMQLLSMTYVCATLQNKKPYLETRQLIYPPDYFEDQLRKQSINEVNDNFDPKPYLTCGVEGEQVNCNPVSIALATLDEKHWASRAIGECVKSGGSSIELKMNELMGFLAAAYGTLGVLTSDIGIFFMYISFRAK